MPVQADQPGTALVSGYSQAQMKMFLDSGDFEDAETDVVDEEMVEDKIVHIHKSSVKMNPLSVVHKAISHRAYEMLKVYD
jgi:hypothetical protein